jgi:hypothetical protein
MTLAFFCAASFDRKQQGLHVQPTNSLAYLSQDALYDRFPDRENIKGMIRALVPMIETREEDIPKPFVCYELQMLQRSLSLSTALRAEGLLVEFDTAVAYSLSLDWKLRLCEDFLLAFDKNKLLVTIPETLDDPTEILRRLWYFSCRGYVPVVMHTEQLLSSLGEAFLLRMKDMGCAFQMDLLALTTFYGKKVQEQAKALLSANMINYITADFKQDYYGSGLVRVLHQPWMIAYLRDASLCNQYYKKLVLVYDDNAREITKPLMLNFL